MTEIDRAPSEADLAAMTTDVVLFDFDDGEPPWFTVNDDVMGGVSTSLVTISAESQRLTFAGNLSLDNNGGFASARSQWTAYDLEEFDGVVLRVRGDGKTYQVRIRTELTGPDIAYTASFVTEAGTWQEVHIPFSEMVPFYRGFFVREAGPLQPATIRSFGLMLADKQQGDFSLDVDRISAVSTD